MCEVWESFDALADRYDQWFDSKGRNIFLSEVAAFRKTLPTLRRPFLEIGVGTGRFAKALGIEFGVDPSPNMLAKATERGIHVARADGGSLPFPSGIFGAVFCVTTLSFVPHPRAVLQEAFRVLRMGGGLSVGFIPSGSKWGVAYAQKGRNGHPLYSRARFQAVAELSSLLESTGFRLETAFSTLFQPPRDVEEVESPVEGAREDAGFVVLVSNKPA